MTDAIYPLVQASCAASGGAPVKLPKRLSKPRGWGGLLSMKKPPLGSTAMGSPLLEDSTERSDSALPAEVDALPAVATGEEEEEESEEICTVTNVVVCCMCMRVCVQRIKKL